MRSLLCFAVLCVLSGLRLCDIVLSSHVIDFNTDNKLLTQKLLKQGYWYHKLRKTFSKYYRQYYYLISIFRIGLKSLLHQGLSEP